LSPPQPHRRAFLRRLALLGLGAGGLLVVRNHLVWPTPEVRFAEGDRTGWMDLPLPGGLVELSARVAGAPVSAVVDSGAQYSAIDADLAKRLRLPAASPIPIVAFGVSGPPRLTQAVRLDADLGRFALKGVRAATLNLGALTGLTRQPFSMLLGRDFLRAVVADLDFPGQRAAFYAAQAWRPPPDAVSASARAETGALMVDVAIEGGPPIQVLLDTGSTGALAMTSEAARQVGLLDGRPMRRGPSVTLGGVGEDGIVKARELVFAGHSLRDVDVQVFEPSAGAAVPSGLLGLGVLERFRVTLDLSRGRLFLTGPEHPPHGRRSRSITRVTPPEPLP
jgi:predicted aspartyl protease